MFILHFKELELRLFFNLFGFYTLKLLFPFLCLGSKPLHLHLTYLSDKLHIFPLEPTHFLLGLHGKVNGLSLKDDFSLYLFDHIIGFDMQGIFFGPVLMMDLGNYLDLKKHGEGYWVELSLVAS